MSVFVLTHHARPALEMEGGTVFQFVTEGIEAALGRAREAADGRDVRLGGGVAAVRQYLNARLIDEMHVGPASPRLWSDRACPIGKCDPYRAGQERLSLVAAAACRTELRLR